MSAPNRRPSLAAVSPAVSGRRLSSGITPNVATPAVDSAESRRGSLRDLPTERDAFGAALRQYDRDLKSGKHAHCTYPAIRSRMLNTLVDTLPQTISADKAIVSLDGATDPVGAFDHLIDTGLEAIPVTVSQHHTHNTDGTITIHSTHFQYPHLYKQIKDREVLTKIPTTPSNGSESPATGPSAAPVTPSSPKPLSFSTPAKERPQDSYIVIDPANSNAATLQTTATLVSSTSSSSLLPTATQSAQLPTIPSSPSVPSSSSTPSRSLRESLNLSTSLPPPTNPHSTCPSDCIYRQAAGWLDIRDLASCIVYVYQQPINEDLLEFREGGVVEQPFVLNTRGLDGITDLPGLTHSSSYSSLTSEVIIEEEPAMASPTTNTSSLHPTLPEETTVSHIDSMGIVYEDDEAKVQGLQLKALHQKQSQSQSGFSHRLSLAPMAEEDDTFGRGDNIAAQQPSTSNTPLIDLAHPSTPTSIASSSKDHTGFGDEVTTSTTSESQQRDTSRSRSQSRHRRKLVTADELSSELTEGGGQGWINTLKQGLGKFASVGNISIAYLSRRHPLRSVKSNATLYDVLKLLSVTHAHRVVIVDEKTNKMVDIISHRTIIKWLWENREEFFLLSNTDGHADENIITDGDETSEVESSMIPARAKSLLDKNIDDLNIGTRNLIQVRNDILGLDALQEMDEHSRTGLAVVDDCGRLVGATSARTIKRITHERDHKTMSKPLLGFIEPTDESLQAVDDVDEGCMVSHGAVVLLDEDVTFGDVLKAMYKHNTNRIFLVDEESYPTKVISLSDILQLILY